MKKNKSFSNFISEGGLWDNIHKRRKKGLPPKKPGQKGYPKTLDIESKEVNEMLPAIAGIAVRKMVTKKIGKMGGRVAGAAAKSAMSKEKEEGYVSHAQRAAVWANRADGGKGHPDNKKKKKSKKEAYEPITTKRSQALAKADAEPKKPVTLPKAPWDKKKEKSEMTDNEKTRSMAKANKKVGAYKPAKRPDDEMREGLDEISTDMQKRYMKKAVPQYKKANDKKNLGAFGSATQKGADANQKKYDKRHKGIGSVIKRKAKGDDYISTKTDRAIASDPKRNSMTGKPAPYKEGAMKRMSTGDGMDTYKKKPDEVKSINKGLMKNRNNPQEKDKDVKKINKSLADMRGEAFSARAIVKKDRQGDGKPMSGHDKVAKKYGVKTIKLKDRQVKLKNFRLPQEEAMHTAPGARGPEHKAAVKKYVSGMKSRRPGNTTSTLPRQMKDPKKDAMVSKGGKVKVVDKNKEADHLKRGYVRAEDTITKELFMKEAKTMMVTHPKTPNKEIKITTDQWPSFKMRGYHHAEQKEMNMNTMKLINKMKKASPAAKKALEAPSRVDDKDDKKVNELTIADVRKATEKAKKRQEKERKATGKTSTSTTDLASRKEDVNPRL